MNRGEGLEVERIELSVADYITLGFWTWPNIHLMYYCLVGAHITGVFCVCMSVAVCFCV